MVTCDFAPLSAYQLSKMRPATPTSVQNHCYFEDEFEDTKEVIRNRKWKTDRQHNGQKKKDKHRSTKHYAENQKSSNMNPTKNRR
jgi:hypothetical protein